LLNDVEITEVLWWETVVPVLGFSFQSKLKQIGQQIFIVSMISGIRSENSDMASRISGAIIFGIIEPTVGWDLDSRQEIKWIRFPLSLSRRVSKEPFDLLLETLHLSFQGRETLRRCRWDGWHRLDGGRRSDR